MLNYVREFMKYKFKKKRKKNQSFANNHLWPL